MKIGVMQMEGDDATNHTSTPGKIYLPRLKESKELTVTGQVGSHLRSL